MASIKFQKVVKDFGTAKPAVSDLYLDIPDEEFLVIVGPSGCGKSTTLRMLAGLESPTSGDIIIDEIVVNHLTPKQRDIAMVFQSYALYPHKNVFGNLAFPLLVSRIPKDEIDRRVRETAEIVGISDLLDRKPGELSGGQRQRVALGRAIIREPRVFLMDEPLSNLDAKLRIKMRAELKKLQRKMQITTIYVTHDQVEAMTMGDRIAILDEGILQQIGPPGEVYHKPVNKFVAGFIGAPAMNFVDINIIDKDGTKWIKGEFFQVPVPEGLLSAVKELGNIELAMGIRPEHIFYPPEGKTPDKFIIAGEVSVAQPRGHIVDVQLRIGDDEFFGVFSAEYDYEMGQPIKIGLNPEKIYLFNKETGITLY